MSLTATGTPLAAHPNFRILPQIAYESHRVGHDSFSFLFSLVSLLFSLASAFTHRQTLLPGNGADLSVQEGCDRGGFVVVRAQKTIVMRRWLTEGKGMAVGNEDETICGP
jgi:hypothetical protein